MDDFPMEAGWLVSVAAIGWCAFALTVRVVSAIAAFIQPSARRRAATRIGSPPVSIVIPVKRMDPEIEASFVSAFSQNYPRFEVLITAAETESCVIDLARKVAARYPAVASHFILGNDVFTLNPKVSNLAPAIERASHDLILIKDSNVRLLDGQLGELVCNLTQGTGMVCAVPIGMTPKTFSAEIACAMMNGRDAPLLLSAWLLGIDIGFGKIMLFDRSDFNRAGGIAVMANTFGDDHALAKALSRIGLRTSFGASVVHQVIGAASFREVWDRQLRWMMIRRDEAPLVFCFEVFFGCIFAALAGAFGAIGLGWSGWLIASTTIVAWFAIETAVVILKHWGWSWRYLPAGFCREFLIIAMWVQAWVAREVQWGGRRFKVGAAAPRHGSVRSDDRPPGP